MCESATSFEQNVSRQTIVVVFLPFCFVVELDNWRRLATSSIHRIRKPFLRLIFDCSASRIATLRRLFVPEGISMLGRHFTLALLALLTGSVAAWSNENIANSEHIPVQPQETPLTDQTMTGLAPQITMAPEHPRYGLMPRVEFSKPSNVCGYNPANGMSTDIINFSYPPTYMLILRSGFPLSCAGRFDTCAYNSPPYAGCCQNGIGCTSIPVKCIGYNDVLAGSCNPKTFTDRKTACWYVIHFVVLICPRSSH